MRGFLMLAGVLAAAPALAQVQPQPGQYETTSVIESMNMPGVPPEVLTMMKGRVTTMKICLTEADMKKDPKKMLSADKSCELKRYNYAGGKIDAEMTCKSQEGPMTMVMTGTYTTTSYAMRSTMSGGMNMVTRVSAKRIGPCK